MAEIIIRQLIDDLDGKPIDTGLGHEVTFSYQGVDYRIDLRPTNADKIEAVFAPYINAAEKVSSAGKPRTKTSAVVKASGWSICRAAESDPRLGRQERIRRLPTRADQSRRR